MQVLTPNRADLNRFNYTVNYLVVTPEFFTRSACLSKFAIIHVKTPDGYEAAIPQNLALKANLIHYVKTVEGYRISREAINNHWLFDGYVDENGVYCVNKIAKLDMLGRVVSCNTTNFKLAVQFPWWRYSLELYLAFTAIWSALFFMYYLLQK